MRHLIRTLGLLALTAVLGLGVAACGDDEPTGGGSSGKALSLGFQQPWTSLPVYVAQQQGFFKKHGIDEIEIVQFTDLPALTTALSRGQVDAILQTMTLLATFNAQSKGSPLTFFAPGQKMASAYVASADSGIPPATSDDWQSTVRAWKGKTIGVGAVGGINDLMTRYMAEQVGMREGKDYTITTVAAGPPQAAALKAGTVDVTVGDGFGAASIVDAGAGDAVLDFLQDQGPELYRDTLLSGYMATAKQLERDPELYAAFVAAVEQALEFMQDPANEAAVKQTIVKDIKVSPSLADRLYPTIDSFQLELTPELIERTTTSLTESGLLEASPGTFDEIAWTPEKGES